MTRTSATGTARPPAPADDNGDDQGGEGQPGDAPTPARARTAWPVSIAVLSGTSSTIEPGVQVGSEAMVLPSGAMIALVPTVEMFTTAAAGLDGPQARDRQLLDALVGVPEVGVVGRREDHLRSPVDHLVDQSVVDDVEADRDAGRACR